MRRNGKRSHQCTRGADTQFAGEKPPGCYAANRGAHGDRNAERKDSSDSRSDDSADRCVDRFGWALSCGKPETSSAPSGGSGEYGSDFPQSAENRFGIVRESAAFIAPLPYGDFTAHSGRTNRGNAGFFRAAYGERCHPFRGRRTAFHRRYRPPFPRRNGLSDFRRLIRRDPARFADTENRFGSPGHAPNSQ